MALLKVFLFQILLLASANLLLAYEATDENERASGIPGFGPGRPNLGSGLPSLGSGLPSLGSGLPSLGSGLPNLGNSIFPNFGGLGSNGSFLSNLFNGSSPFAIPGLPNFNLSGLSNLPHFGLSDLSNLMGMDANIGMHMPFFNMEMGGFGNMGLGKDAEIGKTELSGSFDEDHGHRHKRDSENERCFFNPGRLISCNYTQTPGLQCASCQQTLLCFNSNVGVVKTCGGFARYCNRGFCSFTPEAGCNSTLVG